jgi:putative flippase GtrA
MKKIISFLWQHRGEVLRYLFVGGSGFFIDVGILYFFKEILFLSATLGVVFSQAVVMFYNFFLNKYWSFGSKESGHTQFVKFIFLMGVNYSSGVGAMYVFHDIFSYNYIFVRVCTVGFFVPFNFLLYKYWIYKK